MSSKLILKLGIIFLVCFNFMIISHHLLAQDFFPCGVFNFDVWGPEIPFSSAEIQRIRNINANWVGSVSLTAQGGMIDSFSTASGEIRRMTLERDTLAMVFGHYYPVNPGGSEPDMHNTLLWRYLCDNNNVADIDSAHVDTFVTHINSLYNGSSGLGGIMVAHQGRTNQQDRWPYIKYTCSLIQRRLGDAVQAVVVYNTLDWTGTSLEDFFRYVEDTLDVFQHECYPFHAVYPNPAAYTGDVFQNLIDEYIAGCDSAHLNLVKSENSHIRMEMCMNRVVGPPYFAAQHRRKSGCSPFWHYPEILRASIPTSTAATPGPAPA